MDALQSFIGSVLAKPVPDDIHVMAKQILAQREGVVAILAYGSTLRDAPTAGSLIDYFVLVETRASVASGFGLRILGSLIPPNVYYAECKSGEAILRAKYAVVTVENLLHRVGAGNSNPYFWARFAQPTALVFARDSEAVRHVHEIVATAIRTAFGHAKAVTISNEPLMRWTELFSRTYTTELRPEGANRAGDVVQANVDYYEKVSILARDAPPLRVYWPIVRIRGKTLTTMRLCKAAFTFSGGADYILWKIERHTGERFVLTAWQRRHPVLAGLALLPKLLRKGVVR
jgi:hypothetical protein